tara:strand:- start:270 stop:458 length:189 start_codon:yes stop_codon:yes gene_type:complete
MLRFNRFNSVYQLVTTGVLLHCSMLHAIALLGNKLHQHHLHNLELYHKYKLQGRLEKLMVTT